LSAVAVPELLMVREFVVCVFVAVIVKFPVTTRLEAVTFPKLWNPDGAKRFPYRVVSPRTVRFCVDVVDNTFRSPWTLL
jgi:hypothetical protein